MSKITDLTNTTWVIPAGWSATHNYGIFSVNYDYEYGTNSGSQTILRIGFDNGSGDNGDNIMGFGTESIYPATAFTIAITGGVDATNPALISWLETYSEKPAPTNAVTVEYNGAVIAAIEGGKTKAIRCKNTFMRDDIVLYVPEVPEAKLQDKTITENNTTITPDEGFEGFSSVTIEVPVEVVEVWSADDIVIKDNALITFTIAGTTYEAEEGMTWYDWIASEYNVDEYYTSDDDKDRLVLIDYSPVIVDGEYVRNTDIIVSGKAYGVAWGN